MYQTEEMRIVTRAREEWIPKIRRVQIFSVILTIAVMIVITLEFPIISVRRASKLSKNLFRTTATVSYINY